MSFTPQNKVQVLLAVWGEEFINEFLDFSLPSLLAPGNLPFFVNEYSTKFIILTRSYEIEIFESNKFFQALKLICAIEFHEIDDLIVVENHSTTLTYAYNRAIQKTQEEMLHTYFILLNGDYIFAEASFMGISKYLKKGYSAICAGNFQVIENEIKPFFKEKVNVSDQNLKISARELLHKSLQHLHPVTMACMINQSFSHNYAANRFFFRHSKDILVGRFYLLHVLCIKPEITNYEIASSFDYSFVPEMCPSGNIGVIDDSDDYLVIEMQPKFHELKNVMYGPYHFRRLVEGLSEWTTEQHRKNSQHIIYYHLRDISEEDKKNIKEMTDSYINKINLALDKGKPKPYRNHPYWIGSNAAFNFAKTVRCKNDISNYYDFISLEFISKLKRIYYTFSGRPPSVSRGHYRWYEYHLTKQFFERFVGRYDSEKVIALYDKYKFPFVEYCRWLKTKLNISHHYHIHHLRRKNILNLLQKVRFDACVLFISLDNLKHLNNLSVLIDSLLNPNGKLLIFIPNDKLNSEVNITNFPKTFSSQLHHFTQVNYHLLDITSIRNNFSLYGSLIVNSINEKYVYSKRKRLFWYVLTGFPGWIISLIRNLFKWKSFEKKGYCTGFLLTLIPAGKESSYECNPVIRK